MASLSNAKSLGGVGGILAIIPGVSLIGWILILVALKEISDVTQDKTIFDDALIAGITAVIGAVAFIFVLLGGPVGFPPLLLFFFGGSGVMVSAFGFLVLGILWALLVVSSFFLKRAYDKVSQKLNVGAFATAGLLYLIGSLTSIIFIGFLILLIALIFQIVAYFSIQDHPLAPTYYGFQPPQPMPAPSPQVAQPQPMQPSPARAPTTPEFKFCFKCGTRLAYSASYCTNCGTRQ